MKGKEEDEEKNQKICRQRTHRQSNKQTDRQTNSSNTEATLILCGSSGERANTRSYIQVRATKDSEQHLPTVEREK